MDLDYLESKDIITHTDLSFTLGLMCYISLEAQWRHLSMLGSRELEQDYHL